MNSNVGLDMLDPRAPGHCLDDKAWQEFSERYGALSRSDLCRGDLSDFALANAQFICDRYSVDLIAYQTAAKDRIRWLSVQLGKALRASQQIENHPAALHRLEADGWQLVPVEPTYEMCKAGGFPWEAPPFPQRYKAMLAASPAVQAQGVTVEFCQKIIAEQNRIIGELQAELDKGKTP